MKTSLNIEDSLFRDAQKEALKERKTISEIISLWAREGKKILQVQKKSRTGRRKLEAINLGDPARVDLTSRRDWMDTLDS